MNTKKRLSENLGFFGTPGNQGGNGKRGKARRNWITGGRGIEEGKRGEGTQGRKTDRKWMKEKMTEEKRKEKQESDERENDRGKEKGKPRIG